MNIIMKHASILVLVGSFALAQGQACAQNDRPRQEAQQQLHKLFQDRHLWELEQFPEVAMSKGDYSNAHRVTDTSLAAVENRHQDTVQFLSRLHLIGKNLLAEEDLINYELFELDLRRSIEGHRFRTFLAPVGGRFGPQQQIPQMAERVRFSSELDYDNYLTRLEQVPKVVENTIEKLRLGLKEGRTPPQVTLMGVPQQLASLVEGEGLNALAMPFDRFPDVVPEAKRRELRDRFDSVSRPSVRDALAKLSKFFVNEYLPYCRQSIAAIDWPEGEEYYTFQLRVMTTTEMTAREIHELGLSEVARIRAEMMEVIRQSDFLSLHTDAASLDDQALFNAFIAYLRTDRRFYHETAEDLLVGYRDICKRVDAWLPKFFKTLPRLPYGVTEIPAFMAPQQTTAYYQHGDIRNAEPGFFMANTYALDQRPKYEMIPLAMHEAVPGHHLQVAIAQELEDLPEFRKDAWFTAFGEGWALYSERLGIEMGLYEDPYDNFGRLLYEMWRACRLVVDPGMHALGWSREKAIRFMLDNTALSELNIKNEIDRYIAWPGQATAYKIGELKVRALRSQAVGTLRQRFDIRMFHDVVLTAGAVPLTTLQRRVEKWIDTQRIDSYD